MEASTPLQGKGSGGRQRPNRTLLGFRLLNRCLKLDA
jgi:hypothetical protein